MSTTRKAKRTFSFSGSSPLTPARRIYSELEAGDSLSQSPAAKRAKRSGRSRERSRSQEPSRRRERSRSVAPTDMHPTPTAAVQDQTAIDSSETEGFSDPADKDANAAGLHSLADHYNIKLAEVAGTERKKRHSKSSNSNNTENQTRNITFKNEPSIFNPAPTAAPMMTTTAKFIKTEDTPTKIIKHDYYKLKKEGGGGGYDGGTPTPSKKNKKRKMATMPYIKEEFSPSKKMKDIPTATTTTTASPIKTNAHHNHRHHHVDSNKMDVDDETVKKDVAAAITTTNAFTTEGGTIDNRIPSPPLLSDNELSIPLSGGGTRTLKSINKRLKSLDAKMSSAPAAAAVPSSESLVSTASTAAATTLLSEEVAVIKHLQEDVHSLAARVHCNEVRAQVRHQMVFNALKTLTAAVNGLVAVSTAAAAAGAGTGDVEIKTEDGVKEKLGGGGDKKGKATNAVQTQTLEHCLGKYMDDLGKAATAEDVAKVGKLCVQYAGDLFKTL